MHYSRLVATLLGLLCAFCLTALAKKAAPSVNDDPVALESLREACANGSHLEEHLIEVNYQKFVKLFEDQPKLEELVQESYELFVASVKQGKRASGTQNKATALKQHTSRLCGMLLSMESMVNAARK